MDGDGPTTNISYHTYQTFLKNRKLSPSGFNLQPTHIILVRDKQTKRMLAKNAMLGFGNILRVDDSSAVAVF